MVAHQIDPQYHGYFYHYYRAEVYRETNWRNRLDVTTNWSIVVTAAILSYAFGNANTPHAVIIMNYLIVLFFLYIESRRFRYYTMLKSRTRILESGLLAPIINSIANNGVNQTDIHMERLANSLAKPKLTISKLEAISWRIRRVYIFLLSVLYLTWLNKLTITPERTYDLSEIISRAFLWFLPGWVIFGIMTSSITILMFIAMYVPRKSVGDDLP